MQHEESNYPADWIRIAEKDFNRVRRFLDPNQCDPELAGFCLQQALEKFLKAYLLVRGWKLRRIHNLDTLIDDAIVFDKSFEKFRSICIRITSFYFLERYPSFELNITLKDVRDAFEEASVLVEMIRNNIKITRDD